ncbi:MAG: glycosyltransferase [Xanthomonadales bacterium]|nr:glycosyltransferase [Xanthomonadales bacterium]
MLKIVIICPTYDHQDSLYASLKSVQQQSLQDFEVHVIGDGSPPRTSEIMAEICATDSRFHFQAFPKDVRHAEARRDELIRKLEHIEYFAYIADDDLWLPWHLELLIKGLQQSGFAHSINHQLQRNGHIQVLMFHNRSSSQSRALQSRKLPCFGLSHAAHTRAAYFQLKEGWVTTPREVMTDLHMWAKFAENPQISQAEYLFPTVLHLPANQRHDLSPAERNSEAQELLKEWDNKAPLSGIIQRSSFIHSFDFMLLPHTPQHLNCIEDVLAYHEYSVELISRNNPIPDPLQIKTNTLYLYPFQLECLSLLLKQKRMGISREICDQWDQFYKDNPVDNDILYRIAEAELALGNPQATINKISENINFDNCQSNFLILMAHAFVQCNQIDNAQKILENGINRFPGDYWVSLRLLELYLHCGLTQQARELGLESLKYHPNDEQLNRMCSAIGLSH